MISSHPTSTHDKEPVFQMLKRLHDKAMSILSLMIGFMLIGNVSAFIFLIAHKAMPAVISNEIPWYLLLAAAIMITLPMPGLLADRFDPVPRGNTKMEIFSDILQYIAGALLLSMTVEIFLGSILGLAIKLASLVG